MSTVTVISFGYGHGPAPASDLLFDLRRCFHDPHPELRELTAADEAVVEAVTRTPGVIELVDATAAAVRAYLAGSAGAVTVAFGCTGGRHRAPVAAKRLAALLDGGEIAVTIEHRDLARPVIERR